MASIARGRSRQDVSTDTFVKLILDKRRKGEEKTAALEEVEFPSAGEGVDPVGDIQFQKDVVDMALDRAHAQE